LKKNILKIDEKKCKECGLCIEECPQKILAFSDEVNEMGYHPVKNIDPSKCTGCTFCAIVCPDCIIEVIREEE
jgi:2-oxoglutarate ferredoxin oxidoreductase subunit delta